jgi:ADP-ribose pyrophosphatase YjhB (NUDIX family)
MMTRAEWIDYLERVLATAQIGLTFSKSTYDIERFRRLQQETAAVLATDSDLDAAVVRDWIDLDSHYATPKLDVRALVLDEERRVLLVRESADGLWSLPGGWCDVGESAGEAVVRETLEETGLSVKAVRLLALFDKHKHAHPPQIPHAHKAFFFCQLISGSGALQERTNETTGARYFPLASLPPLSRQRVLPEQISRLAERAITGELQTLFD